MKNKTKLIISSLLIGLSISTANAGVFGFVKKNPVLTAVGVGGALYLQSTMHKARDLSYNLPKVEPFFQANPQDFNPIANYVLKALANPNNKKDYDRYKKLAEIMGLDNIPPYVAQNKNQPTVLEIPIEEQNSEDLVYENPIQQIDNSNIISTPIGNVDINDLREEFPNEHIDSWEDYLFVKNSYNVRKLERDMKRLYGDKPYWYAPHHIVAWDDPRAKESRDVLNLVGIDINAGENGIYVPQKEQYRKSGDNSTRHPLIHTDLYYDTINQRLRGLNNRQDVIDEIDRIRDLIKKDQFPY